MQERNDPRAVVLDRWETLMASPASEIGLDEGALLIAACRRPSLDLVEQLSRLDELAAGCASPTLDGVLRHLFGQLGFAGALTTYDDPDNSFLDRVLTRRVGIPITLSVVTIEVGRRLGLSLHGVGMPGHFLVGSHDESDRFVDAFGGGTVIDRNGARELFHQVSGGSPQWDPAWLLPVDTTAILLRMLNNLKSAYGRRGDVENLRWVMQLRARVSSAIERSEREEFARLMAPTN